MTQFLLAMAIDTGKTIAVMTAVVLALMAHPKTRRVSLATVKFTSRHAPSWAKWAMVAAAFFPGQADEIALVAILLFPILRNERNRRVFARTVRYAWNG